MNKWSNAHSKSFCILFLNLIYDSKKISLFSIAWQRREHSCQACRLFCTICRYQINVNSFSHIMLFWHWKVHTAQQSHMKHLWMTRRKGNNLRFGYTGKCLREFFFNCVLLANFWSIGEWTESCENILGKFVTEFLH